MGEADSSLLNSKGGFNRCALPRLQVIVGDRLEEYREEKRSESNFDTILTARQDNGKRKSREFQDSLEESVKSVKTRKIMNGSTEIGASEISSSINNKQFIPAKRRLKSKTKDQKNIKRNKSISTTPSFNVIPISTMFDRIRNRSGGVDQMIEDRE